MAGLLTPIQNLFRRRKRDQALTLASAWPITAAKLLKSAVVEKDALADGGTAFQNFQVESAFYFTHQGSYFGGHLRSLPLSDSEAHRALQTVPEDTLVIVRYNPHNPDQTHVLASDNEDFPFAIWSM